MKSQGNLFSVVKARKNYEKPCIGFTSFCGMEVRSVFVFLCMMFTGLYTSLVAQPYSSTDDLPPCFEIDARVRNGNAGFEGVLFTPSTPPPGQQGGGPWQMNPTGAPIWNSNGNVYGLLLLNAYGQSCNNCVEDLNDDGTVNTLFFYDC